MWTAASGCQAIGGIALNLMADEVGVPWLLKVANQPDVPASGAVSAKGTIGGTTARPTAMVAVQGCESRRVRGEAFGSLRRGRRACRAARSRSRVSSSTSRSPISRAASPRPARYHLDRRTYTADVQSEGVRLLGLRLPGGELIRGDVQLAARGDGQRGIARGHGRPHVDSLGDRAPAFALGDSGAAGGDARR